MGYVDPNAFGLLSQVGYLVLFSIVSGFMFFSQKIRRFVGGLWGRGERRKAPSGAATIAPAPEDAEPARRDRQTPAS